MSAGPGRKLLIGATALVVAVLAVSLWAVGSPAAQRDARLDDRRTSDLQRLVQAVEAYWEDKQQLPPDLASLARVPGQSLNLADPAGGPAYTYEPTDTQAYRLCATFITDTADYAGNRQRADEGWVHGRGRHCFERRVSDPDD